MDNQENAFFYDAPEHIQKLENHPLIDVREASGMIAELHEKGDSTVKKLLDAAIDEASSSTDHSLVSEAFRQFAIDVRMARQEALRIPLDNLIKNLGLGRHEASGAMRDTD